MGRCQKLGIILENKVILKLMLSKNVNNIKRLMYHFHSVIKNDDTFWTRFVIMWLQIVYSLWYCQPPFIHPLPDRGEFINFVLILDMKYLPKRICSRTSALELLKLKSPSTKQINWGHLMFRASRRPENMGGGRQFKK